MYVFISILILITCVLLAGIVLVQNSKGGGLAANFSSQNQIMGVRKTADFLEKATWTLVIVLLVLSLLAVFVIPKNTNEGGSHATELTVDESNPTLPAMPVQQSAPATEEGQPE